MSDPREIVKISRRNLLRRVTIVAVAARFSQQP